MNTAAYAIIGVIGIQRSDASITARMATRGKSRCVRYRLRAGEGKVRQILPPADQKVKL